MDYDCGQCHVCGGQIQERLTEQSICEDGDRLLVRSVPAGVCTRCGEQVLRTQVSEQPEQIVRGRKAARALESLLVPVFAFSPR